MEDLTGEVDDEEEEGGKAESNSCISIYYQSKAHDMPTSVQL